MQCAEASSTQQAEKSRCLRRMPTWKSTYRGGGARTSSHANAEANISLVNNEALSGKTQKILAAVLSALLENLERFETGALGN